MMAYLSNIDAWPWLKENEDIYSMSNNILPDRSIAVSVFLVTIISTLSVALVCIFFNQSAFHTVIYSLITMWIMGIVGYIAIKSVYMKIIRPHELQKLEDEKLLKTAEMSLNISEVQDIDTALEKGDQLIYKDKNGKGL